MVALVLILFGVLALSGGPSESEAHMRATPAPVALPPAGPSWDF